LPFKFLANNGIACLPFGKTGLAAEVFALVFDAVAGFNEVFLAPGALPEKALPACLFGALFPFCHGKG